MEQILQAIKENRVLNILLNPRGTISRKEYWFALLLIIGMSAVLLQTNLITSYVTNMIYENVEYDSFSGGILHLGNSMLSGIGYLPLIPYNFIALYSSFIIVFKRAKGHFSTPIKWLLGALSYLFIVSLNAQYTSMTFWQSDIYNGEPIFQKFQILLFVLLGLAILPVIILSCLPSEDEIEDSKYGSLNFLFKVVGLNVIALIFFTLLALSIIGSRGYFSISSSTSFLGSSGGIAYIVTLFFLIVKRAQDAKIPVYLPISIILGLTLFVSSILVAISFGIFTQISITVILIPVLISFLLSIYNALAFVFIALPTKEPLALDEFEFKE